MKKPKCITPYCKNPPRQGKRKCHRCIKAVTRRNNIMRAAYSDLRSNARRRGKEFTISFDDFKQFCYETNYMAGKGKTATSYSIDRIDNNKGYVPGNLRMLTLSENAKKGTKILQYDYSTKQATVVNCPPADPDPDLPF